MSVSAQLTMPLFDLEEEQSEVTLTAVPSRVRVPKEEAKEKLQDIRTDVQKGRKVSYDVGEKIGGARKDEFELKEKFLAEKSVEALHDVEGVSTILAAELVKREQLFDSFSLENEKEKGVDCKVAYFKKLTIQRIDKHPADSVESRKNYVSAAKRLKEKLDDLKTIEDVKTFIRHMNNVVISEGDTSEYYVKRIERLKSGETAVSSEQERERRIANAQANIDWIAEANESKYSSLGKSFKNLFSKKASLQSTLNRVEEISSWDELLKPKQVKKGEARKPVWERDLPERPDRTGGKKSNVEKPDELLEMFSFRGVEFGNYVDDQKGKEHIFRSSEALLDLADILKLNDISSLSLNSELALAFGARGRGKALGHYEPSYRVINFTRDKGTLGILAHEWFHALDNHIGNLSHNNTNGLPVYLSNVNQVGGTVSPSLIEGMKELLDAIINGESVAYFPNTNKEGNQWRISPGLRAKYEYHKGDLYSIMKAHKGKTIEPRLNFLLSMSRYSKEKEKEKAERKVTQEFKKYANALAWYHEQQTGEKVTEIPYPSDHSQFFTNAVELDRNQKGKYWSSEVELVARAFEAWVEDQLHLAGRRSDYLVFGTKDPQAYPAGDERTKINSKMTSLIEQIVDNVLNQSH